MYELIVKTDFAAAHCLREYQGACERLHGHNYKVDVVLQTERLDATGMAMDFKEVKARLGELMDRLDHQFLNETPPFDRINPTAENLARWLAEQLAGRLPEGVSVQSVTTWESDACGATYRP
jgi:6-pyruvoyltetrahydropterin/6-carboxytetrahydropterin synthase